MPLSSSLSGDRATILLTDTFTYTDAFDFKKEFAQTLESGAKHIDIALQSLVFMDSAGFALLVMALKECRRQGIALTLKSPRGQVVEVLRITGAYDAFEIAD